MMSIDFTYSTKRRPASLCQLAGRWDGKTVPEGGIMSELKLDGWRGLYFRGLDGQPALWTRNGRRIEGVGHIVHRLGLMERAAGCPLFVDGEYMVGDTLAETKAWCESGWKAGGEAGQLFAFDCMPLADWESGRCDVPLFKRKARLIELLAASYTLPDDWEWRAGKRGDEPATPITVVADTWLANSIEVDCEARMMWAMGLEGLMLKNPMAPYVRARSNDWLKVKRQGVR